MDDIAIDLWFYWNFASMEDIQRKCNSTMNLSKCTLNNKILNRVVALVYD